MVKKAHRNFLNKFLKILLYLCVLSLFILFVITIVLNIKVFTKDTHRLAEEVVREFTGELDDYVENMAVQFDKYQKTCANYKNDDEYADLIMEFGDVAEKDDYLGFSIKTIYGDSHKKIIPTNINYNYEIANEDYMNLAISNKKSLYYVYWNNVAGEICLSYYRPVDIGEGVGNGIQIICGTKSLSKIIDSLPELKNIMKKFDGTTYFVYGGGKYDAGFTEFTEDGTKTIRGNFFTYIGNKYLSEDIEKLKQLKRYEFNSIDIKDNLGESFICTKTYMGLGESCDVYVRLSKSDVLMVGRNDFSKVIISLVLTFLMFTGCIVLLFYKWRHTERKKKLKDSYIAELKCSSFSKFTRDAQNLILNNPSTFYAMVTLMDINIKYISERFGKDEEDNFRRYASKIIGSVLKQGETYCWLEKDAFLILMTCPTKAECTSKISLIKGLLGYYDKFKKNNFNVKFSTGVYFIKLGERIDISLFAERSNIAMLANSQTAITKYSVFDDKLYEDYKIQAKIESKMESALKHEDFHIFFQPKYNIKNDKIDGAETLVRWYDKKRDGFIGPGRFIKVFESNGFINKLDRYVFVKTCEFLAHSVKAGLRVTTISVNVSRVTAIQKDFISFYTSVKKKYNIPNNYITIEFTESFSFEDMDVLYRIVMELKENGFQCSIDDFGSGYSSCGMLKALPMDELKLDMFLLRPSGDLEKDKALVKNMINLGKAFDMKITQEGVETMEQFEILKSLDCDVIQGYLYSKPLIGEDFTNFVNGKTDLKTAMENNEKSVYRKIEYIDFTVDDEDL